jgi:hypothetical protein
MTRRLDAAQWPRIAAFFRGYLHQDAGDVHRSLESAFEQFWDDASHDERTAFAAEWRALLARTQGRPWRKVEPLVASLGAAWLPRAGTGFARLARHISRRLEPGALAPWHPGT